MSRGLGRNQEAVLASLYSAHRGGAEECDLSSLIDFPEYDSKAQLRSARATLRRTFRTLETRKLVECETKTEPHPSLNWPFASDATIERLYLRITAAGIDYVESRALDSLGQPEPDNGRNRRAALAGDNDEWAFLDWARAGSRGSGREAELDLRERRLIEAALKRGATWKDLARKRGYSGEEAMRRRYRLLCAGNSSPQR